MSLHTEEPRTFGAEAATGPPATDGSNTWFSAVLGLSELQRRLFTSPDLESLIEVIPLHAMALLPCDALHLWLFEADALRLMSTAGHDSTVTVGTTQAPGEGYVSDTAESGVPLRIVDLRDPRLTSRSEHVENGVFTAMLVPLMQDNAEVGVLEAVNRSSGGPFTVADEDLFRAVAQTVSSALSYGALLSAEKKLSVVEAVMQVSADLGSTLQLSRLAQLIVHSPQLLLPYDRCVLALNRGPKLRIKAVSGFPSLPFGDARVQQLSKLMVWLSAQSEDLHLQQQSDGPNTELPSEVAEHFRTSGFRSLYAFRLSSGNRRIGYLLFEGTGSDFFQTLHLEMARVIATQAATALSHALLFRELPSVILQPWLRAKQAIDSSDQGRKRLASVGVAAALLLLLCPFPARVAGVASVAAQHAVTVAAPVEGVVSAVFVREGERVEAGQVIGALNDLEWRTDLLSAEARYHTATLTMEADLARGAAQAGADRAQVEFLRSEADRARARIAGAQLRSPITGVVMTSKIENAAGEHLYAGNAFAQILDLSSAVIDVAVPQGDVALVKPEQSAVIKLQSYPQKKWSGSVSLVSAQAEFVSDDWAFDARVPLANQSGLLRAGMTGVAKISIGYRPVGYVLFRQPALWVWQTLWTWLGW